MVVTGQGECPPDVGVGSNKRRVSDQMYLAKLGADVSLTDVSNYAIMWRPSFGASDGLGCFPRAFGAAGWHEEGRYFLVDKRH